MFFHFTDYKERNRPLYENVSISAIVSMSRCALEISMLHGSMKQITLVITQFGDLVRAMSSTQSGYAEGVHSCT